VYLLSPLHEPLQERDVFLVLEPRRRAAILVIERHPLRLFDAQIERLAASADEAAHVQFFLALDDALIKRFASPWTQTVLNRLEMQEGEAMSSAMIDMRLLQA